MLQSDKGTEYKNSQFQSMLKECDIRLYTSENDDIQAVIVERFNRTLTTRMHRYFTYSNRFRYVDVLQYTSTRTITLTLVLSEWNRPWLARRTNNVFDGSCFTSKLKNQK